MNASPRIERAAISLRSTVLLMVLSQLAACGGGGGSLSSLSPPAPPAPPPVAAFSVHPKYLIGSVIYAPPGPGSSITYGSGTMLGTTVSTASSWSKGSSAGPQIGSNSITFGDAFGGATANSVDLQDTFTGLSISFTPPSSDTINHDYDQVVLFFGVDVNASVDAAGKVTWGMDFSQILSRGFATLGYFLPVGCLRPSSNIYSSSACTSLQNMFTDPQGQFQLTADDFANIVAADPYADPATAPQAIDSARYAFVTNTGYFNSAGIRTLDLANSRSAGNAATSTYSYLVAATTSSSYDGVSLKDPATFMWTNSSTLSNRTGSSPFSTRIVIFPPSAFAPPSFVLFMYQDTIYKTFMFSFTGPSP